MKIFKTLLVLSLVLVILPLFGQNSSNQIIKKDKGNYEYQGKIYNKYQLDFIFKEDPVLSESYALAIQKCKTAKKLGYGTLGLLGLSGLALAMPDSRSCDNCWQNTEVFAFVSIFIVVPITGSIATIKHLQSNGKLKKVINGFNDAQVDKYGRLIEEPRLSLSSSGAGLKISF